MFSDTPGIPGRSAHRPRTIDQLTAVLKVPDIKLSARPDSLELRFPPGWLDDHPLTVADLQAEIELLKGVGFRLRVFTAK